MSKNKEEIPRSADMLAQLIIASPGLLNQSNPQAAQIVEKLAKEVTVNLPTPALIADKWLYRTVVSTLGLVTIIAILGSIFLSATSVTIPDVLTALGSAAIGALAGLLAPSPSQK
jgi:hypothetical protein